MLKVHSEIEGNPSKQGKSTLMKGDVLEKGVTAVLYFLLSESDTLIFRKSEEDGGRELISSISL